VADGPVGAVASLVPCVRSRLPGWSVADVAAIDGLARFQRATVLDGADVGFNGKHHDIVRETGGRRSQRFFHAAVRRVGMTLAQGALPLLRAATDPRAVGGALYTPRWVNWARQCAGAPAAARSLPEPAAMATPSARSRSARRDHL
jgi:hypothetical protein